MAQFITYWPMTTAMVFLAVVLLSAVSLARLPVNLLPDIASPRLLMWINYCDLGPAEIEASVTIPVEKAATTLPGTKIAKGSFAINNLNICIALENIIYYNL